jgi:hypothetical protein
MMMRHGEAEPGEAEAIQRLHALPWIAASLRFSQ